MAHESSPGLDSVIKRLQDGVHGIWRNLSDAKKANLEDLEFIRAYWRMEDDVELLFDEVEKLTAGSRASTIPRHVTHREFRAWVIGDLSRGRARILATILSLGSEYLLRTWARLLKLVGQWSAEEQDISLCDRNLPFSDADAKDFFCCFEIGEEFCRAQHKYCPLDPAKLDKDFGRAIRELRTKIKATTITWDNVERGKTTRIPGDEWIPYESLEKVLEANNDSIKNICVGYERQQADRSAFSDLQRRREYYNMVRAKSEKFVEGVKHCTRLFATLILAIDEEWPAWSKIFNACCGGPDPDTGTRDMISDSAFPFGKQEICDIFGQDCGPETIYHAQSLFCAIKLQDAKSGKYWRFTDRFPTLPIHRREYRDHGAYGHVYFVKVAAGYFFDHVGCELAMKVIDGSHQDRYTEWRLHEKMVSETTSGIMVPLALIKTTSKFYIFMPLADANLDDLMWERAAPVARHGQPGADGLEQQKICLLEVPRDLGSRHEMLGYMLRISYGLRHLHHENRDLQMRHNSILHGDLKAKNILYTQSLKPHPLQIADFGAASYGYGPQLFNPQGPSSTTETRTRLHIGSGCPNYPPEAEDGNVDRMVDMWQFGIVFSEYVAWLSGGRAALCSFDEARARIKGYKENHECHSYYRQEDGGVAIVKDGIKKWYSDLVRKVEDPSEKNLFSSCKALLFNGLLVCDPKKRIKANRLCEALEAIMNWKSLADLCQKMPDAFGRSPVGAYDGHSELSLQIREDTASEPQIARSSMTTTRTISTPQWSHSHSPDVSIPTNNALNRDSEGSNTDSGRSPLTDSTSPNIPGRSSNDASDSLVDNVPRDDDLPRVIKNLLGRGMGTDAASKIRTITSVHQLCGHTLLHLAVKCAGSEATEALLEVPGFPLLEPDKLGRTALHVCARAPSTNITKNAGLLVEKGSSIGLDIVNARDKGNKTALELLTDYGANDHRASMFELLFPHTDAPKKLGKEGGSYGRIRARLS